MELAAWIGLGIILVAIGAIRVRVLGVPLERDEGEYAYAGQLMLQGIPPYQLAYNMKLPGTYAAYAVSMAVFGQTIVGVRLGLLIVNAATIVLLFVLGRRLFGAVGAFGAAAAYGLFTLQTEVLGLFGHATHFVVLPAVAGILVLLTALENGRSRTFFAAGLLFGSATSMKQPGAVFVAFAVCWILWSRLSTSPRSLSSAVREIGALLGGTAVPIAGIVALLAMSGVLPKFWFWVFTYASRYVTSMSLAEGWDLFRGAVSRIIPPAFVVCGIAAGGLILLTRRRHETHRAFLLNLGFWSFIGVCPGLYFREHYFIVLLPLAALLVGLALQALSEASRRKSEALAWSLPGVLLLVGAAQTVLAQRDVLFEASPIEVSRLVYGPDPFPEAIEIGSYLHDHTRPDQRIAIFGSEPEVCFYARRKSATGHIYMYGLMAEEPFAGDMQAEMIQELEAMRPAYIVWVAVPTSWLEKPRSDRKLVNWAAGLIRSSYEVVGQFARVDGLRTRAFWGDEAMRRPLDESTTVLVLRRRSGR